MNFCLFIRTSLTKHTHTKLSRIKFHGSSLCFSLAHWHSLLLEKKFLINPGKIISHTLNYNNSTHCIRFIRVCPKWLAASLFYLSLSLPLSLSPPLVVSLSLSRSVFAHLYLASEWCKREKNNKNTPKLIAYHLTNKPKSVHTTPEPWQRERESRKRAQKSSLLGWK